MISFQPSDPAADPGSLIFGSLIHRGWDSETVNSVSTHHLHSTPSTPLKSPIYIHSVQYLQYLFDVHIDVLLDHTCIFGSFDIEYS